MNCRNNIIIAFVKPDKRQVTHFSIYIAPDRLGYVSSLQLMNGWCVWGLQLMNDSAQDMFALSGTSQ